MTKPQYHCWRCGSELVDLLLPVSRREECPDCRAEVHACRMCQFYLDRPRHWCREERAELPAAADTANFCDYFAISERAATAAAGAVNRDARDALSALFEDGDAAETSSNSASDELNNLFDN